MTEAHAAPANRIKRYLPSMTRRKRFEIGREVQRGSASEGGVVFQSAKQERTASVSMIVTMRPDHLASAKHEPPSKVFLTFADGVAAVRSFQELGLDMANMKLKTIRAAASGTCMQVKSKWNDDVEIDAAALRAMIDPAYAAECEKAFRQIRGPIDDLAVTAKSEP